MSQFVGYIARWFGGSQMLGMQRMRGMHEMKMIQLMLGMHERDSGGCGQDGHR